MLMHDSDTWRRKKQLTNTREPTQRTTNMFLRKLKISTMVLHGESRKGLALSRIVTTIKNTYNQPTVNSQDNSQDKAKRKPTSLMTPTSRATLHASRTAHSVMPAMPN